MIYNHSYLQPFWKWPLWERANMETIIEANSHFKNDHYGKRLLWRTAILIWPFWNTAILTHGHSGNRHCGTWPFWERSFWDRPLWETAILETGIAGNGHCGNSHFVDGHFGTWSFWHMAILGTTILEWPFWEWLYIGLQIDVVHGTRVTPKISDFSPSDSDCRVNCL